VIDPGADAEAIARVLQENGLRIRHIVATHAHFDHLGAMKALQEAWGGETVLHPKDLPLLENLSLQGASFGIPVGPPPRIDRLVKEGDWLSLGSDDYRIQIVHTPGHSPGGISLLAAGMAFVGDTLFAGSVGRTDLPGGSAQALLDSIRRKLLPLPDEVLVFPGHGEVTTIGQERTRNPFLNG
jgi:glyoxylase-like metal-dependent hydrolase (beta-lactamase superfamily II)